MKRFKVYHGLHRITVYAERMEAAIQLKEEYAKRLKNGWKILNLKMERWSVSMN
jgi:hypothetical protein